MNEDLFAQHAGERIDGWIAGVDEAGRGPLAGPVVIAAVILNPDSPISGLADSKSLTAARRELLAIEIRLHAFAFAICAVEADEIDELNILAATMAGMSRAVSALSQQPVLALIDGNRIPHDLPCRGQAIVRGDASEPVISAASILAKTERDRIMCAMDQMHPGYDFARHKGYPTVAHMRALGRLGPCPQHRRSFAPVSAWLAARESGQR